MITVNSTDKFKFEDKTRIGSPTITIEKVRLNFKTGIASIEANFAGKSGGLMYDINRDLGDMTFTTVPTDAQLTTFLNNWITANKIV